MQALIRPRPITIKVRIDRENIDANHLLHIYNFNRLPVEVQEEMIAFIPEYSRAYPKARPPQPILLTSSNEEGEEVEHYVSPKMLTEFCSDVSNKIGWAFFISIAPNVKVFLDNINFSCLEPPYMRSEVAATKLANAISRKEVEVKFSASEVIFSCNKERNFVPEEFAEALGLGMYISITRESDVDIFALRADPEAEVTIEMIQNAVFRNYGNLLIIPADQKSLNVIESYISRGR